MLQPDWIQAIVRSAEQEIPTPRGYGFGSEASDPNNAEEDPEEAKIADDLMEADTMRALSQSRSDERRSQHTMPNRPGISSVEYLPPLCAIFGNKSKAEIKVLDNGPSVNHVDAKPAKPAKTTGSALGKRKANSQPDMHQNLGAMSCYYCAGVHNDISGGPRIKNQCGKRKQDVKRKVFRRNIWSYPRAVKKARGNQEPTPKTTGKGKSNGKDKQQRTVVPTEDCLQKDVWVDACNAVQMDSPASPVPSASPPNGMEFPPTPGRDQPVFDAQETDDLMDAVMAIGVNGGRVDENQAPSSPGEQLIAGQISLQKMRLEDKAADSA
ncbi:hypothetical protein PI124_g21315 [Phytophthora idaei]|nr:hypothetical protein PI126_g15354 [Phytophthora idaei]KAG3233614.1 hypothetical protein PI124_g21315 [Phytophthora idaei]